VVQFYADDHQLVGGVTDFLIEALRAGGVAVAVATPEHRAAFEALMTAAGVDARAAAAAGAFIALDAEQTLRGIVNGDRPDAELFATEIGTLIHRAASRGRVHVYGEMVDLLWQAGHMAGAMELEEFWNDLGRQESFALYCAYRAGAEYDPSETASDLARVCLVHSSAFTAQSSDAPGQAWASFTPGRESPRRARSFVVEALRPSGDTELVSNAALVVSELASNAVVHARSPFTVRIARGESSVRISVLDNDTRLPVPRTPPPDSYSGRGLALVSAVATAWGSIDAGVGKVVWAELPGPSSSSADQTLTAAGARQSH
jgi:hypothetical protein